MMFSTPMRSARALKTIEEVDEIAEGESRRDGELVGDKRFLAAKPKRNAGLGRQQIPERPVSARTRAQAVERTTLDDIQSNLQFLREELLENMVEETTLRQEVFFQIKQQLDDQRQNFKQEQLLRQDLLKCFKAELGDQVREALREEQLNREDRLEKFKIDIGNHIRGLREDICAASSEFKETVSTTYAGNSQMLETIQATMNSNGQLLDNLQHVQGRCFTEVVTPFREELVSEFKQELAGEVRLLQQEISKTSNEFQSLKCEIQSERSRVFGVLHDYGKLVDIMQPASKDQMTEIERCMREASKDVQKYASCLENIERCCHACATSVDQLRREGVRPLDSFIVAGTATVRQLIEDGISTISRNCKHDSEGLYLQFTNFSSHLEQQRNQDSKIVEQRLHDSKITEQRLQENLLEHRRQQRELLDQLEDGVSKSHCRQVDFSRLESMHSELVTQIEQTKKRLLEAMFEHTVSPRQLPNNVSVDLPHAINTLQDVLLQAVKDGKADNVEAIRRESGKNAKALVDHCTTVLSQFSARRDNVEHMHALNAQLYAVPEKLERLTASVEMVVRQQDRSLRGNNSESTLRPEPAVEPPSSFLRQESREPRASVTSNRILEVLSGMNQDLTKMLRSLEEHISDQKIVWESQEHSFGEVSQKVQELSAKLPN